MTGEKFEMLFCELLQRRGFWALRIPKNSTGAQPFDVIAIRGDSMLAIDCKVCKSELFPIARIEDNQWLAFGVMAKRTTAQIGIAVYHKEKVVFVPYEILLKARETGKRFIDLTNRLYCVIFAEEEVKAAQGG